MKLEAPDVCLDIDDLRKFSRRLLAEEQVAGVELRLRKRREEDIQTDWLYVPSTQVGGGALGYHWIDNTHFICYLLDVSGHGVAAALVSVSVLNTLCTQCLSDREFLCPGQVLTAQMSTRFRAKEQYDLYFAIWYGVFNRND